KMDCVLEKTQTELQEEVAKVALSSVSPEPLKRAAIPIRSPVPLKSELVAVPVTPPIPSFINELAVSRLKSPVVAKPMETENIQHSTSDDISSYAGGSETSQKSVSSHPKVRSPKVAASIGDDISSYGGSASSGKVSVIAAVASTGSIVVVSSDDGPMAIPDDEIEYDDDFTQEESSKKPDKAKGNDDSARVTEPTPTLPSAPVEVDISEDIEEEIEEDVQYEDEFSAFSEKKLSISVDLTVVVAPVVVAVDAVDAKLEPSEQAGLSLQTETPATDLVVLPIPTLPVQEIDDIEYEDDFISEKASEKSSHSVIRPTAVATAQPDLVASASVDLEKGESKNVEVGGPTSASQVAVFLDNEEIEEDLPSAFGSENEEESFVLDTARQTNPSMDKEPAPTAAAVTDAGGAVELVEVIADNASVSCVDEVSVASSVRLGPKAADVFILDNELSVAPSASHDSAFVVVTVDSNETKTKSVEQTDEVASLILGDILTESVEGMFIFCAGCVLDLTLHSPAVANVQKSPLKSAPFITLEKEEILVNDTAIPLEPEAAPAAPVISPSKILDSQESKLELAKQADEIANQLFAEMLNDLDGIVQQSPEHQKDDAVVAAKSLEELAQVHRSTSISQPSPEFEETEQPVFSPYLMTADEVESRNTVVSQPTELPSSLSSNSLLSSLTSILSAGVPLTSSQFANDFVDLLLQRLPPPSTTAGYNALPQLDPSVQSELMGNEDLDYALKSRYALLLSAVQESMEGIFSLHSSYGKPVRAAGAFTGPTRKRGMLALLPPRPVAIDDLKRKVKSSVSGWTSYSELYGENLDTMLIEEVKEDEDEWKNLEYELELVRENTFQEILADVVQETTDVVSGVVFEKRAAHLEPVVFSGSN
ncbi:UNVERIFIED_CONTAM: hypothetical protein HDU68_001757, partial [Siphonaria sp. JEL0065]